MNEILRAEKKKKTERKKALRLAVKLEKECRDESKEVELVWHAKQALGYVGMLTKGASS